MIFKGVFLPFPSEPTHGYKHTKSICASTNINLKFDSMIIF